MRPKLISDAQIEETCRGLFARIRHVTLDEVGAELRRRYGAIGRRARLARIFSLVQRDHNLLDNTPPLAEAGEPANWAQQLEKAERRARESEERELANQRFFARRYAEQCDQLERERAAWYASRDPEVRPEQYLRLYQRAAALWDRLSKYEKVEPLLGEPEAKPGAPKEGVLET